MKGERRKSISTYIEFCCAFSCAFSPMHLVLIVSFGCTRCNVFSSFHVRSTREKIRDLLLRGLIHSQRGGRSYILAKHATIYRRAESQCVRTTTSTSACLAPNLNTWIRSDELRHLSSINDNFSRDGKSRVDGSTF